MTASLHSIRTTPPLTDCAGQLRALADLIDSGELPCLCVVSVVYSEDSDGAPNCDVFRHGKTNEHDNASIGILQRAVNALINFPV